MSELKIVVAGSRQITTGYDAFVSFMNESIASQTAENDDPAVSLVIITGGAKGVDQFGKRYARQYGYVYREFKPQYRSPGDRGAPLRRNTEMAMVGDLLIALWDGNSTGTKHMIDAMKRRQKPVYLMTIGDTRTHALNNKKEIM